MTNPSHSTATPRISDRDPLTDFDPPRDFRSRVLDFVIGPENYHPIEYQLYYVNLRRNAEERVSAYLRERAEP